MPWRPGDAILMRSVYHGRVAWALPHTFVESTESQLVWLSTPGTRWQGPPDGDRLVMLRSLVSGDMQLTARTWHSNRVLRLTSLSGLSSIDLYWDNESDAFLGWYVNLQAPPVRSRFGFDVRDHVLDVWIEPDGSWQWKDEDELENAIEIGLITDDHAAAARAEGERVIAAWPFPTGWEDFRPDSGWHLPRLPEGWQVV